MWLLALAAFFLLLLPPEEAWAQRTCDKTKAAITTAPLAAPTERVTGIPGKRIYLCGYMIIPSSNPPSAIEFELTQGVSPSGRTDCGNNRTVMIPRLAVPASGIINRGVYASGETTGQGESVCLQTWGTGGSITSVFYWAQF